MMSIPDALTAFKKGKLLRCVPCQRQCNRHLTEKANFYARRKRTAKKGSRKNHEKLTTKNIKACPREGGGRKEKRKI